MVLAFVCSFLTQVTCSYPNPFRQFLVLNPIPWGERFTTQIHFWAVLAPYFHWGSNLWDLPMRPGVTLYTGTQTFTRYYWPGFIDGLIVKTKSRWSSLVICFYWLYAFYWRDSIANKGREGETIGTKCSFHLVPHFAECSNSCHSDTPSFGGPIFSPPP